MTRGRRGAVLAGAAAILLSAADIPAQVSVDLFEPLPILGYLLKPGITPPNLAENIEGFTTAMTDMAAYDRKFRAKAMTPARQERLETATSSFGQDREILLMYLAWLQDAVERAPRPGTGLKEDGVDSSIAEKSSKQLGTRKPLASDFFVKKRELPEHERGQDAQLKPGDLEFKSKKP